jgi:hypothetical protein
MLHVSLQACRRSLSAMEGRSPRRIVPGRRRARACGRSGEGAAGPVASEGHMQAHPTRRPVIVGAVVLREVECRCDRRAAGAQWLPRWRVDFGDLDVPKSFTR